MRATRCIAERLRLRADDVSLGPTALSSSYQLVANLLPVLHVGGTACVMSRWSPEAGWDAADRLAVTVLAGNPTVLRDLLDESARRGGAPTSLRLGLSGGGPVPPDLKYAWRDRLGLPLCESYGQSELGGFVGLWAPDDPVTDGTGGVVRPPVAGQGGPRPRRRRRGGSGRRHRRDLPAWRVHGAILEPAGEDGRDAPRRLVAHR